MDPWKEFAQNFDKWLKLCCYIGFAWVLVDILPHLPPALVDRIINGLLAKVGL